MINIQSWEYLFLKIENFGEMKKDLAEENQRVYINGLELCGLGYEKRLFNRIPSFPSVEYKLYEFINEIGIEGWEIVGDHSSTLKSYNVSVNENIRLMTFKRSFDPVKRQLKLELKKLIKESGRIEACKRLMFLEDTEKYADSLKKMDKIIDMPDYLDTSMISESLLDKYMYLRGKND